MDDHRHVSEMSSVPMQLAEVGPLLPPEFVPLGLMLMPNGMRVDLKQPDVLIGRHSEADLRLPLPDVSRRHCRCVFVQSRWHVMDLDSLNGIYVNDRRVQKTALEHGDQLRIGGFVFAVDLAAAGEAEQPISLKHPALEKRRAS